VGGGWVGVGYRYLSVSLFGDGDMLWDGMDGGGEKESTVLYCTCGEVLSLYSLVHESFA
jgi:hypothetical protein